MNAVATQDFGQLGPAMRALPNDQWRAFVLEYVRASPAKGSLVAAYRAAGFGRGSTPTIQAKAAWRMSRDERAIAAITEENRKILKVAFPEGANALLNLIRDPEHKEHGRALGLLMDRVFPVESKHHVEVVHKTVDPDREALEELRALRSLGTPREKLLELFGANGLDRIEALEADDRVKRSNEAKVIEHEASPIHAAVLRSTDDVPDPEMDSPELDDELLDLAGGDDF